MKTVAVIVAAYQAQEFIHECVESVLAQELPPGWAMDMRIGVDGCLPTSAALTTRCGSQRHYASPENYGTYVIRNSLVKLGPAHAYAIFDADDVMLPGYLHALVELAGDDGIAGAARRSMDVDGGNVRGRSPWRCGVCVVSWAAWNALGGYRAWRIVGDWDLWNRARALKIPTRSTREALFLRRIHEGSLTMSDDVGFNTHVRREMADRSVMLTDLGYLYVNPVTVPLYAVA